MANDYIQNLRKPFAAQLENEAVREQVWAMMVTEDGQHPGPCLESLFNRLCYVNSNGENKTILQMLHGGFYGPYNRGMYPRTIAEVRSNKSLQDRLNATITDVLAGSNVIQGFTDQGLPTDPNGQRQPQIHVGGNIFNDWGGGPGGHAGAEKWRQEFQSGAAQKETPAELPGLISKFEGIFS